MKKVMSLVLVCVMILFAGCSSPREAENVPPESSLSDSDSSDSSDENSGSPENSGNSSSDNSSSEDNSNSEGNKVYPPFFKITDPNTGGTAYLLGTIHVGVENTVYPSEVYAALDESSALAVELDLQALEEDQASLMSAMMVLVLTDGTTTADYLGEDYDKVLKFFKEKGMYVFGLEYYIPAMWSSMLSSKLAEDCGLNALYGTDREMLTYAKKQSKKIVELESAEEQYKVLAGEAMELQAYSLKSAVEADYEEQKDGLRELYRAWSVNDSAAFESMVSEEGEIPEGLEDEYAEYYYSMYEGRQKNMAAYIESSLANGDTVFVAVGSMHCYATPDILDFLDGKAVIEEVRFAD